VLMIAVVAWARMQLGDWAGLGAWYLRLGWLLLVVGAGALAYGLGLVIAGVRPRHLREA
jgi:putative peptidoglycan lipid II flippase